MRVAQRICGRGLKRRRREGQGGMDSGLGPYSSPLPHPTPLFIPPSTHCPAIRSFYSFLGNTTTRGSGTPYPVYPFHEHLALGNAIRSQPPLLELLLRDISLHGTTWNEKEGEERVFFISRTRREAKARLAWPGGE